MTKELKEIQQLLKQNSNAEALAANKKFVPGVTTKVYGVRNPVVNELAKKFKAGGFELVEALWGAGAYEEKLLASKILGMACKKDPARTLELIEKFAPGIDNWAVCDTLGMQGLKPIFRQEKENIFKLAKKYNKSPNLWERRLSLVLVEWYTRFPELHAEITKLVKHLENDPEYYVRKAVIWIRKNFEKGK